MNNRCYKINDAGYKTYGGRGITVCDEWRNSFSIFREWATTHKYTNDLTIDRADNDKGYEPSNCRFITKLAQQKNKTSNRIVETPKGTMILIDAAKEYKIHEATLRSRLKKGWPLIDALCKPVFGHTQALRGKQP